MSVSKKRSGSNKKTRRKEPSAFFDISSQQSVFHRDSEIPQLVNQMAVLEGYFHQTCLSKERELRTMLLTKQYELGKRNTVENTLRNFFLKPDQFPVANVVPKILWTKYIDYLKPNIVSTTSEMIDRPMMTFELRSEYLANRYEIYRLFLTLAGNPDRMTIVHKNIEERIQFYKATENGKNKTIAVLLEPLLSVNEQMITSVIQQISIFYQKFLARNV